MKDVICIKRGKLRKKIVVTVIFWLLAAIALFPFLWMISSSFKAETQIFKYPIEWIPKNGSLRNYKLVWQGSNSFIKYYKNSLIITLLTVVGSVVINTMAGYAFARIKFKHRNALFLLYIATMMVPTQVTLIPRYMIFHFTGLLDSLSCLILPGMFRVLCVFLMRQAFMQIPFDYSEAATIDGASEWTIFTKAILPLATHSVVTTVILVFTSSWNDYDNPLIFITKEKLYPITLGLNNFKDELGIQYGPLMAASLSSMIVLIVVFIIGQKTFIDGLTSGGIKG
jgi:multiple sugar transport system permease protein